MAPWLVGVAVLQLVLLVAFGIAGWYLVRTLREREPTPPQLATRMTELEQEFLAFADGQARFLKKLSKRERDSAKQLADDPGQQSLPLDPRERIRQKLAQRHLAQRGTA